MKGYILLEDGYFEKAGIVLAGALELSREKGE